MNVGKLSDLDRRQFVLGGAALAGSAVAGCCTVPPQTLAGVCATTPEPFLAGPQLMRAWAGSERHFDVHTEELDIPVMAHDNQSNGRDAASDRLAAVTGWNWADRQLSNLTTLRVNAGHFGGARVHGDGADGDRTLGFIRLMQSSERLRLYGDFGFWDERVTEPEVQARLRDFMSIRLDGATTVADRTLYGSDWLMLSQTPGWEGYADGIARVLKSYDRDGSIARRVLGDNVLECYGLKAGSGRKNLDRMLTYCSKPGRTLPGWMQPTP